MLKKARQLDAVGLCATARPLITPPPPSQAAGANHVELFSFGAFRRPSSARCNIEVSSLVASLVQKNCLL